MASRYRHRRTSNPATAFPNPVEPGELVTNTANRQVAVGDAASGTLGAPIPLIAVRYFDARAKYATDDLVQYQTNIFRARTANGPGAFNFSNWSQLTFPDADTNLLNKGGGTMVGPLFLAADAPQGNTAAAPKSYIDAADAALQGGVDGKVGKAGDTMTGPLVLAADPTAALGAATKQMVDAKADKTYVDAADTTLQTNINTKADKTYVDTQDALKAPLASPAFTGTPTAPTPSSPDLTTKVATTAFVNYNNIIAGGTDLNTITAPGLYATANVSNNPNEPTGAGQWYLAVWGYGGDPNHTVQLAISLLPDAAVYTRTKVAGTWRAWVHLLDGNQIATANEYLTNVAGKILTTDKVWTAAGQQNAITDAASVTPDFSSFNTWYPIARAGVTVNNPINTKTGQAGVIVLGPQVAGCSITTWGSAWRFPGGVKPTVSTNAGANDALMYRVWDATLIVCSYMNDVK